MQVNMENGSIKVRHLLYIIFKLLSILLTYIVTLYHNEATRDVVIVSYLRKFQTHCSSNIKYKYNNAATGDMVKCFIIL